MRRMHLQNAAFHWQTQGRTKKRGTNTICVLVDFQALALGKSMRQKSKKYVCTFQTVRTLLFSTFLLMHRPLSTQESSRMWFRPEDIHTDALDKIIASSRDRTEVDMVEVLMDIMEVKNLDEVSFCVNDLAGLMNSYNDKSEIRKIRRILKDSWKLQPASNAYCYRTFAINFNTDNHYEEVSRVGKYYTVSKTFLKTRR